MNDKEITGAVMVASGSIVLVGIAQYVRVWSIEKKKRNKIKEWETENLTCITSAHGRLNAFIMSEDFTFEGFAAMLKEENDFLKIIQNQPMY